MTYEIETYREEFLDDQERVGKEATRDWTWFAQTPANQLREAYSQPGFDPETRHYCFKDGKLVGFLTSEVLEIHNKVEGRLEFPIVLPGHKKAESLLMGRALDVLRIKGVRVVKSRVSETWGSTAKMARKYGYEFSELLALGYNVLVDTVDIEETPEFQEIEPYDHERDVDEMVDIFVREYDMTPEQARQNFEDIKNRGDQVVAHLVIRKGEKIAGRAMAYLDENDPSKAFTATIHVTEEPQRILFMKKMLKICKEKKIKELFAPIFGELLQMKDQLAQKYEDLGFEHVVTISYYKKKI